MSTAVAPVSAAVTTAHASGAGVGGGATGSTVVRVSVAAMDDNVASATDGLGRAPSARAPGYTTNSAPAAERKTAACTPDSSARRLIWTSTSLGTVKLMRCRPQGSV